jgi:hypothetical protein
MPWPKGKPHSEETRAKMRVAQARRPARPQTAATRAKVSAARVDGFRLHGHAAHPLYPTWRNIVSRCENPADKAYPRYGGRGISILPEWRDVAVFITWIEGNLGPRPEGMTLDRWPDNNGNYEPGNVRWADAKQQRANQGPRAGERWKALKEWLADQPNADAVLAKMSELETGDVLVVSDESGYFGESTRGEIEYAYRYGKPVRYLYRAAEDRADEMGIVPEVAF